MAGNTCNEAADLPSEAQGTPWTVPGVSTSELNGCCAPKLEALQPPLVLLCSSVFHFSPLKSGSECNEQSALSRKCFIYPTHQFVYIAVYIMCFLSVGAVSH